MTAEEAAGLIRLFEENGIEVYVDGGWAVDALLGEQTRAHQDLDIALPQKHVARLRDLLSLKGYREQPRPDTWECNFVLADAGGNEVDVHSYTLDEAGNNVGGVAYKREHLTGRGVINHYAVKCISPEWLIRFHSGYALDENDYRDVGALCERFGITLPEEYRRFGK
jgi:lincosamide nucleotidyltransferase A/C/D/E